VTLELKIDPEFKALIPSQSKEEHDGLISNLNYARNRLLIDILTKTQIEIHEIIRSYDEYTLLLHSHFNEPIKWERVISTALKKDIIDKYNNKCGVCDLEFPDILQIHHIIPFSRDGTNFEENLIPLCPNCHSIVHKRASEFYKINNENTYREGDVQKRMNEIFGRKIINKIFTLSYLISRRM
jgi:predicted restriction endonuclease